MASVTFSITCVSKVYCDVITIEAIYSLSTLRLTPSFVKLCAFLVDQSRTRKANDG